VSLLALGASAAALTGCGSTRAGAGSGNDTGSSRPGPQSIFQADPQLLADPAGTLDTLRRLGVDTVRVFVQWYAVAPDARSRARPGGFDASNPAAYPAAAWSRYDAIVRAAVSRGIAVDLTLTGPPPLWASGPGAPDAAAHPQWRPSAPEFGAFVRAVATRYNGGYTPPGATSPLPRIGFWAIWNEPNYGIDLAPQAVDRSTVEVSPALYRGLLDAAWSSLVATGHGRDTILIGELAPRGITVGDQPGNFSGMVPLRFLRALYCVDGSYRLLRGAAAAVRGCPDKGAGFVAAHPALFQASGLADHPYPQGLPPNVGTPLEPDYADLPAIPHLEQVLDTLQGLYGSSRRLAIYSTEFGYQTDPPETILRAVPASLASYYLNWAEYITWRDPRLASFDQYLLADTPRGNFATGLEFADGRPKATLYAYRLPIYLPTSTIRPGEPVEVWGCVRPADYAQLETGSAQRVAIQFEPRGSPRFSTIRTVTLASPRGYFDVRQAFPGPGTVRLSWSYPHGGTIFSRLVAVSTR
jgi:hypothetical protein